MTRPIDDSELCEVGRDVIETETRAIEALRERIDGRFAKACHYILACEGRVVVTGMGKSGHIGGKIAATLASTGTPAFFVHPGEASHGDLGMITSKDVVIALSNSGETEEILTILPVIKRLGVPLIAMTGRPASRLGQAADVVLDVGVEKEACPHNLAPTSSTTVTLAMGDALAVALLKTRKFTPEDFALSHPAGSLGRRLLLRVDDLMHTGDALPQVREEVTLSDALKVMSEKRLGMTTIVDAAGRVVGIFTDGDLRRLLDHGEVNIQKLGIAQVMIRKFTAVSPGVLAAEALQVMQSKSINALPVVDKQGHLVGAFNMLDLVRAGVM